MLKKATSNEGLSAAIAIILSMKERWRSEVVARSSIKEFTGGSLSSGYLANLDSQGIGIKGAFRIGRRIVYPITSVEKFLISRLSKNGLDYQQIGRRELE